MEERPTDGVNNEDRNLERNITSQIGERFHNAFIEILGENGPQIEIAEFLSAHGSMEDLEGLGEEIDKSDVYIPEINGWRERDLEVFRISSSGEKNLDELSEEMEDYSPAIIKKIEEVHGKQKAITFLDVPEGHDLSKESEVLWEYNPPYDGEFTDVLNYTKEYLDKLSSYLNRRDDYILSQVTSEKVNELLTASPELREKETIKILVSFGIGHSLVPPDFPENSFRDQGIITRRIGREIDDNLASRVYLESFITLPSSTATDPRSPDLDVNYRNIAALKRRMTQSLTVEDALGTFERIRGTNLNL